MIRKKRAIMILSILCLALFISGCRKKEVKLTGEALSQASENKIVNITKRTNDLAASNSKETEAEKQVGPDEVINLKAYTVTVDRYIEDELGQNVTGYMSIDYVEIDEAAQEVCPELENSLEKFNDTRKRDFLKSVPKFTEAANEYAEQIYESDIHEGDGAYLIDYKTCEDYEYITVMRADNVAMSMLTTYVDFWGTDDLQRMYVGTTYDSQTGKQLKITDIVEDYDAYEKAIESELNRKYGKARIGDIDHKEYSGWTLTPEGIMLYYADGCVDTKNGGATSVQISFDEYPDIFNSYYMIAPKEYVIPFKADEPFFMVVTGPEREAVTFSPVVPDGAEGSGEYSGFSISVGDNEYDDFGENWFYGYSPFYVHKKDGAHIYVYFAGYEQDYIADIKFIGDKPICVAKLPATPFDVENLDEPEEEFIARQIAFSNPDMVHDALSFDTNICGTYKGEEGDGWEVRYWDICNIDGKYYLDYIGEYDYMAAEIELLDEVPYLVGEELRYMVRVYPYSGFSFAGDYWGAGQVMYISRDLGSAGKHIELSEGNPFFYGLQSMYDVENVSLHEIQDENKNNVIAPDIIGSWRWVSKAGEPKKDIYMEFSQDGLANIVCKEENYTPMVYRGVYSMKKAGNKYFGNLKAEAIGMGTQPMADWKIEFDPESDNPIVIMDEYDDGNPLAYDVEDMRFHKTEPGKREKTIHPGPWDRTSDVEEKWYEYISDDEQSFAFDFQPEYIDAIIDGAVEAAGGTSYMTYGIQDDKNGGEIWVKVLDDVMPSIQVTRTWVRYDMSDMQYYDIYDKCLE